MANQDSRKRANGRTTARPVDELAAIRAGSDAREQEIARDKAKDQRRALDAATAELALPKRAYNSEGFGPIVYREADNHRVVDEVNILHAAAYVLIDHIHEQGNDGYDAHDLKQEVAALNGIVLMWSCRVPSRWEQEAEEAKRSPAAGEVRHG